MEGVEVRLVHERGDLEALDEVFCRVWGLTGGTSMISPELLRAIAHADGYVAAAYVRGSMVGGSLGFRGVHRGRTCLHSHLTGVVPALQHGGIGRAIKQHQRAWARAREVPVITWTFDPLVRRNAWFNVQRLGVGTDEYLTDFYGPIDDAINARDQSDRLLAVWEVASSRAATADSGRLPTTTIDALVAVGAQLVIDVGPGDEPRMPLRPQIDGPTGQATTLLARVPADIVAARRENAAIAAHWRAALRETMGTAMQEGFEVTEMTSDGAYVLRMRR